MRRLRMLREQRIVRVVNIPRKASTVLVGGGAVGPLVLCWSIAIFTTIATVRSA